MAKAGKTTICDVVDYETDIKPFPLIKIYAGVGSGKSHFASKLITGSSEYGIPKQDVLIITSGRSKVEETLKEMNNLVKDSMGKNGNLSFEVWQTGEMYPDEYRDHLRDIKVFIPDFGDLSFSMYNQSTVCTNAYIRISSLHS